MNAITSFYGDYRWLSNFHPVNFDYVFEVRSAPKHRLQWRPKMNKRWANQKETT